MYIEPTAGPADPPDPEISYNLRRFLNCSARAGLHMLRNVERERPRKFHSGKWRQRNL